MLYEQAILTASDGTSNDSFGISVAISGNTAIVGAFIKRAAYIYVLNGTSWTEQAKLIANDGSSTGAFGYSVAISGDTAIVGAFGKNSNTGAAYIFLRNETSWTQQAILTAIDGAPGDYFGRSVSISGNTAIVGANGTNPLQAAYIFTLNGTLWTQQAKLTADDGAVNDLFGLSVSISGNTAIVGAYGKNSYKGAAYIYVGNGTTWTEQAKLTASDGGAGNRFGYSVSISDNTAIVGAPNKNSYQGVAYIYVRNGTSWTQQPVLTASDGVPSDNFGSSVAILNDTAIVGAPNRNSLQGVAYLYVRNGSSWTQQAELAASDGVLDDHFSLSSAISDSTAIVGAYHKNAFKGAAYIYSTNPVTYVGNGNTSGNPPIDNTKYLQGNSVTVLDNSGSLTKIGYKFVGWNTKSDGTGIYYTPGNTFTLETENIILYAKWASLLSRGIKLF